MRRDKPDVATEPVSADQERFDTRDTPVKTSAIGAIVTSAGVASVAGAIAGLVWGGLGGRIAMRVAFVTSDDNVAGLTSDDGFEIGRFSGDTVFLLVAMTIAGAIFGAGYGLARMILRGPGWLVTFGIGATTAAAVGASIVRTDGIDFRLLDPLWLLVAMFIFLPAAWGVTVVRLTELLLRPGALFAVPPEQIDRRYLGVLGAAGAWLGLASATALGVVDLIADIQELT